MRKEILRYFEDPALRENCRKAILEEKKRLGWDAFAREYTGQKDHAAFDHLCGKFACMDIILRTHFVKPTFAEKIFFGIYVRKLVKTYFSDES